MTISQVGVSNRKACQKVLLEQSQIFLRSRSAAVLLLKHIPKFYKSLQVSSTIFNIAALKAVAIKITGSIGV
jgi:hypothetical protein